MRWNGLVIGSALTLVVGCMSRSGSPEDTDAGTEDGTTASGSGSGSSTTAPWGSSGASDASGSSGGPGSSDGSGSSGSGAIDPACDTAEPSENWAYVIDFGDWMSGDSTLTWDGSCVVGSVEAGTELTTVFDCDGAEDELTTISLVLSSPPAAAPWVQGDAVIVHATYTDSIGTTLSIRQASDSSLLAAFVTGDVSFVVPEDFAPVTVTHDLQYCGWDGTVDDQAPIQLTFTEPDGDPHPLLQGGEATLTGLAGETWDVDLFRAFGGFCCDALTSVHVALVRRPS